MNPDHTSHSDELIAPERPRIDVDIACVGFGPAMGGFLTTLSRGLQNPDGTPVAESRAAPGLPPQVVCYERADDIGFGVSGVVTRARALRESFPEIDQASIPMAVPVRSEETIYLLDPVGASRRSLALRSADRLIRAFRWALPFAHEALTLPWTPRFLHKNGGLILSMGQFMQWIGTQVQATGTVQVWPGSPVSEAIIESSRVEGIRLLDQGVDKSGRPTTSFVPGLEVRAALTVVADGPVGAIGRQIDEHFGRPPGHHSRDWALGMKFVVDLPESCTLRAGSVLHTFGYPEPEIFGFLYVHPDRVASLGVFIPSWLETPVRTAYRYLQHWMLHPFLWQHLQGARLRSWGAKTIAESGQGSEPFLAGDGYARIGEGSGSTNVLTNSGVDEAWATGAQLGEAVLELLRAEKAFTRENLETSYVQRRRASWVQKEGKAAERSRYGFQRGMVPGMLGMLLANLTRGKAVPFPEPVQPHRRIRSLADCYPGRIPAEELAALEKDCTTRGMSLHDAIMDRLGWPPVPFDGQLLVSHQDALLLGGKVQAPPGYRDHVVFLHPEICARCGTKVCIELCSGQAIMPGPNGVPSFDREKCVFCGACLWNCAQPDPSDPERMNIAFSAGAGGLHSAEN